MATIKCKCGKDILLEDNDIPLLKGRIISCIRNHLTVYSSIKQNQVAIPNFLLNDITGLYDHKNRNGHDNRRENWRLVSYSENNQNQSLRKDNQLELKGVRKERKTGKFMARITINGKQTYLGSFCSSIDAAKAYDIAAIKHFGEFACINNV